MSVYSVFRKGIVNVVVDKSTFGVYNEDVGIINIIKPFSRE